MRFVAELDLGPSYGPTTGVRLIAATDDPIAVRGESTWFMATNLAGAEADPAEVYRPYSLRDWTEHYYKPAKHELGWADFQVRPEHAIVRHWYLVMLAFTFSLLDGGPAASPVEPAAAPASGGNQSRGSSGRRRCGRCAAGCARGRACSCTGACGRPPHLHPSSPLSSTTSPAHARLRSRSDQPATIAII